MSKVLIVYGSSYGQTAKISNYIANELIKLKHTVDIYNSLSVPQSVNPKDYDAVLVGASVMAKGYQKSLKKWVKQNAQILSKKTSAFFSVCLGILQNEEVVKQQEIKIVKDFFFWSDWQPSTWTIFAGSLLYTEYNWVIKRIMRYISKKAGGETDMSHDYEYTNWDAVASFARDFSSQISKSRVRVSISTEL